MFKVQNPNPGTAFQEMLNFLGLNHKDVAQALKQEGKAANYKDINRKINEFYKFKGRIKTFRQYCKQLHVKVSYHVSFDNYKEIYAYEENGEIKSTLDVMIKNYKTRRGLQDNEINEMVDSQIAYVKTTLKKESFQLDYLKNVVDSLGIRIEYILEHEENYQ